MAQKKVIPISRRELLKTGVAATAAMSVGLPVTQACAQAAQAADAGIEWHKGWASAASAVPVAVCRSAQ